MVAVRAMSLLAPTAAVLCGAVGCRELEGFSTQTGEIYRGAIVSADPIRTGIDVDGDTTDDVLGPETEIEMSLRVEAFQSSDVASVTTSDGLLTDAPLESIEPLWHDTLSGLTFPAGRLRSGLYFVRAAPDAPGGLAGLEIPALLSLMIDGSVELRLISGPDRLYGLFRLSKTRTTGTDGG